MSYRPEGWKNLYYEACYNNPGFNLETKVAGDAYEAGADAMLEALRTNKHSWSAGPSGGPILIQYPCEGRLIWLPDEPAIDKAEGKC